MQDSSDISNDYAYEALPRCSAAFQACRQEQSVLPHLRMMQVGLLTSAARARDAFSKSFPVIYQNWNSCNSFCEDRKSVV